MKFKKSTVIKFTKDFNWVIKKIFDKFLSKKQKYISLCPDCQKECDIVLFPTYGIGKYPEGVIFLKCQSCGTTNTWLFYLYKKYNLENQETKSGLYNFMNHLMLNFKNDLLQNSDADFNELQKLDKIIKKYETLISKSRESIKDEYLNKRKHVFTLIERFKDSFNNTLNCVHVSQKTKDSINSFLKGKYNIQLADLQNYDVGLYFRGMRTSFKNKQLLDIINRWNLNGITFNIKSIYNIYKDIVVRHITTQKQESYKDIIKIRMLSKTKRPDSRYAYIPYLDTKNLVFKKNIVFVESPIDAILLDILLKKIYNPKEYGVIAVQGSGGGKLIRRWGEYLLKLQNNPDIAINKVNNVDYLSLAFKDYYMLPDNDTAGKKFEYEWSLAFYEGTGYHKKLSILKEIQEILQISNCKDIGDLFVFLGDKLSEIDSFDKLKQVVLEKVKPESKYVNQLDFVIQNEELKQKEQQKQDNKLEKNS